MDTLIAIAKSLVYVALPFSVTVGLAWSLGYWHVFGINPFEYAGATELAAIAAYGVVTSMFVVSVSFIW